VSSNPRTKWLTRPDGLAERLRALREGAFPTAVAFADEIGWYPSKVSRFEKGRSWPSDDDIHAWVATCEAHPDIADELIALSKEGVLWSDWSSQMQDGLAGAQENVSHLIEDSTRIVYFEPVFVPGPLQTAGYTAATTRPRRSTRR
jgi:hypothetical protein